MTRMFLRLQCDMNEKVQPSVTRVARWLSGMARSAMRVAAMGLGAIIFAGNAMADDADVAVPTDAPKAVSLWDRPVPGTNVTYAELTIEGKSPDELEPVLLPLPAPALAAGVGLGVAWLIRRRFGRR